MIELKGRWGGLLVINIDGDIVNLGLGPNWSVKGVAGSIGRVDG